MEKSEPVRYCLYARKSTESDERQAMSIDSQIKEMLALAQREGLFICEIKQESHSAKQSLKRPLFNELMCEIKEGKYTGILTWAPDRLSRNAGDLGALVDLMDSNHLQQIRTFGQSFSNNPNEKFLLMILCSQAKLENDNRGINVRRGIRAKCEMGWRPGLPPLGYFNRSFNGVSDIMVDSERSAYITEMFKRVALKQHSGRAVKRWLDASGFTTRSGKRVTLSQIYGMLKHPFYYGKFEHPSGSGNWYDGSHQPLVSKEIFDLVQEQLSAPQRAKWGSNDFPYKQCIRCISCGASIVGEYKVKSQKNGIVRNYTYYHCSRQVDLECKQKFIREEVLIKELLSKSHCLGISLATCEPGLAKAIKKYLSIADTLAPAGERAQLDIARYSKYVFLHGSSFEIRRLLRNANNDLFLSNAQIVAQQV